jgi:two-component sensor histidine kinase
MLEVGTRPTGAGAADLSSRAALDGADAATVVLDDRGVIVDANQAWFEAAEAFRLSPGRIGIGADYLAVSAQAVAAGGGDASAIAAMVRDMMAGVRDRFIVEYDCSHGGATRWFEVRGRRLDRDGRRCMALTHVDVTERKTKEAEDRLVIRELQHRLHNTVALISSLFSLSARHGGTVEDLVVRFQSRLRALAGSYRLLDANAWRCVSLQDLVTRATAAVDGKGAIQSDGPSVMLVPSDTLNLGLILHELCTNAVRHGALRSGQGRVSIHWQAHDDHVALVWQERGGPAVSLPKTASVGSQIIDAAATNLGARVHIYVPRPDLKR